MTDSKPADPTPADSELVAAIHALTSEIALLRETVAGLRTSDGGGSTSALAASVPAAATAVATVAAAKPIIPATNPVTSTPRVTPKPLPEIESDRVKADVQALLVAAFMATSDEDYDAGFESFLDLMHSGRTDAPRSIPSLREFTWKSLHRKRDTYLSDPQDPTSYTISRWIPDAPRSKDDTVKLFLSCPGRSPVPISFRRDSEHDGAWRITDSSL